MFKLNLSLNIPTGLFDLLDWREAVAFAKTHQSAIYTWKTEGNNNWLEKGISIIDNLALVVLPQGLPDYIDMPNDEE